MDLDGRIGRRRFLKLAGLGAGGLALSSTAAGWFSFGGPGSGSSSQTLSEVLTEGNDIGGQDIVDGGTTVWDTSNSHVPGGVIDSSYPSSEAFQDGVGAMAGTGIAYNDSSGVLNFQDPDVIGSEGLAYLDNSGTEIWHRNNSTQGTNNTTYTKVKEITLDQTPDTDLKIQFCIRNQSVNGDSYGRIYRNGSAVGTERFNTNDQTTQCYTETISGWSDGDNLQIYVKSTNTSYTAQCTRVRILAATDIDVTNVS